MATKQHDDRITGRQNAARPNFIRLEPDPLLREPRPLFGNQIRWAKWVIRESRRERAFRRETTSG